MAKPEEIPKLVETSLMIEDAVNSYFAGQKHICNGFRNFQTRKIKPIFLPLLKMTHT